MAEAISFGLVRKIIEKLGSTTFDEIGSIWGVKDEFQKLKNTVSTIQAVLQDAEEQQDKNHQVRDWLMKLRDAIYDADDLLSDFSTEDLRQRVMGGVRGGARNFCLGGPSCNTNIFIKTTPYTHINTHVFFIIYTHFFI